MENRIREHREARGLSLAALAGAIGTTPSTLSKLELDKIPVTTEWLERLAAALELPAAELIARDPGAAPAADVAAYDGPKTPEMRDAAARGETLWRVGSRNLDQIGLLPGDVLVCRAPAGGLASGVVVVAEVTGAEGESLLIARQFLAPSLLVTNSSGANGVLNMRDRLSRVVCVLARTIPAAAERTGAPGETLPDVS